MPRNKPAICPVDPSRPCGCHRKASQCPRRSPLYQDAIAKGLRDHSEGVPYGDGSAGEIAHMAAYAVLRCCGLITAGDQRVPERIGRVVEEMMKSRG